MAWICAFSMIERLGNEFLAARRMSRMRGGSEGSSYGRAIVKRVGRSGAAGTAPSELSTLFWRADDFAGGDLADAHSNELAGVSIERLGLASGSGRVCGASTVVFPGRGGGGLGGSVEPASDSHCHRDPLNGSVAIAGIADNDASDQHGANHRAERDAGIDQHLRRARAAGILGRDD